jgi:hypothetical protein
MRMGGAFARQAGDPARARGAAGLARGHLRAGPGGRGGLRWPDPGPVGPVAQRRGQGDAGDQGDAVGHGGKRAQDVAGQPDAAGLHGQASGVQGQEADAFAGNAMALPVLEGPAAVPL